MSAADIIIISLSLSMDNMAVAAASACGNKTGGGHVFKTALIFCLTGIVFMTAGFFGGVTLRDFISSWDHWLAFALLIYIGVKMAVESFHTEESCGKYDMTRVKTLIFLAVATNIDVLAAGVSMAFYRVNLIEVNAILAAFVFSFTVAGFLLGAKLGQRFGKKAELAGGIMLILLSLKIALNG